jgi:hypothetical protein
MRVRCWTRTRPFREGRGDGSPERFAFPAAASRHGRQSKQERFADACCFRLPPSGPLITLSEIEAIDRERILRAANEYLTAPPITDHGIVFAAQQGRQARLFFRGGLLVA